MKLTIQLQISQMQFELKYIYIYKIILRKLKTYHLFKFYEEKK